MSNFYYQVAVVIMTRQILYLLHGIIYRYCRGVSIKVCELPWTWRYVNTLQVKYNLCTGRSYRTNKPGGTVTQLGTLSTASVPLPAFIHYI